MARSGLNQLRDAVLWVVQVAMAYLFLYAGSTNLAGMPAQVAEFAAAGQWLRYLIGATEIAGAFLLVIRGAEAAGGLLLGTLAAVQLLFIGVRPAPALGEIAAAVFVVLGRRPTALLSGRMLRP